MKLVNGLVVALFCSLNVGTNAFRSLGTRALVSSRTFSSSSALSMCQPQGQVTDFGDSGGFKKDPKVVALRNEALERILGAEIAAGCEVKEADGGANNIMDFITTAEGKKYVLRIYNNGCNSPVIDFEDATISKLQEVIKKDPLSFAVPTAVPSKENGKTHLVLANGAEGIMFDFIPGELPKKRFAKSIGAACGELVNALAKCDLSPTYTVDKQPNTRFLDIYAQHWMTNRENFFGAIAEREEFNASPETRKYTDLLGEEVTAMEIALQKAIDSKLPEQLIHADLHYDNVLCVDGKVSGLLDFEFSAIDWRACEIAVGLSKYAGEAEALEYFGDYCDGYATTSSLTKPEIEFIPDLIILRILSNVVFFVGRGISGEDTFDALTTRAKMYYERIQWIKDNRQKIVDICSKVETKQEVNV